MTERQYNCDPKERSHIRNLIRSDRVHNNENPGKWLFFAFDGDKMIGHVNGIAWDRAPPEALEHTKRTKAKYNLVGKLASYRSRAEIVNEATRLRLEILNSMKSSTLKKKETE